MVSAPDQRLDEVARPAGPAFQLQRPGSNRVPLILMSPHSGDYYPEAFRQQLQVPIQDVRRTEDAFVDRLFEGGVSKGATQLKAVFGRCYVDLNRDAGELDPDMFEGDLGRSLGVPSARVQAGLGCLPRIGASGKPLYAAKLTRVDADQRLASVHALYHGQLQAEMARLFEDWADIYLIDCHSMPSRQPGRPTLPDIVLGDRFGSSCDAQLTSLVERTLRQLGYSVVRNAPYAGGYTTRRYGRPRRGAHVLQIEINRSLYMNEADVVPNGNFGRVQNDMTRLSKALAEFALGQKS